VLLQCICTSVCVPEGLRYHRSPKIEGKPELERIPPQKCLNGKTKTHARSLRDPRCKVTNPSFEFRAYCTAKKANVTRSTGGKFEFPSPWQAAPPLNDGVFSTDRKPEKKAWNAVGLQGRRISYSRCMYVRVLTKGERLALPCISFRNPDIFRGWPAPVTSRTIRYHS
jgi:hypothetical protein